MSLILVIIITSGESLATLVANEQVHPEMSSLVVLLVSFRCKCFLAESTFEILEALVYFHMIYKAAPVLEPFGTFLKWALITVIVFKEHFFGLYSQNSLKSCELADDFFLPFGRRSSFRRSSLSFSTGAASGPGPIYPVATSPMPAKAIPCSAHIYSYTSSASPS